VGTGGAGATVVDVVAGAGAAVVVVVDCGVVTAGTDPSAWAAAVLRITNAAASRVARVLRGIGLSLVAPGGGPDDEEA
jgi:hypothetical protein